MDKRQYNHDCIIFRFELQSHVTVLGLPIGNHIMIKYDDDNLQYPIMRAYTPISNDSDVGYFELLIKIYSDGEMTQKLMNNIDINDYIECKGPLGSINYHKPSSLKITEGLNKYRSLNVAKIGMLAGGTGITPMYQIIKYMHQNKDTDSTKVSLMFSNKTEKDILLKDELDEIVKTNENIKIYYIISSNDGHIDLEMIQNNLFPPNQDVAVMYCGPTGFNKTMKKLLNQIGHEKSNILRF